MKITEIEKKDLGSCLNIEGNNYSLVFHNKGGGIASLLDKEGTDWVGFSTSKGASGEYRGIPNLGEVFHPGYDNALTSVISAGNESIELEVQDTSGSWLAQWIFSPHLIEITIQKAADTYWFLYEGTPGGRLNTDTGTWISSDGTVRRLEEDWQGVLPKPGWIAFPDIAAKRSLFIINHQKDYTSDQYWPMENLMTVFGYGREYKCCGRYLKQVPARFCLGFAEEKEFFQLNEIIEPLLKL